MVSSVFRVTWKAATREASSCNPSLRFKVAYGNRMPTSVADRADCPLRNYGSQAPKLLDPHAAAFPKGIGHLDRPSEDLAEGLKICGGRPPEPNPNEDAGNK